MTSEIYRLEWILSRHTFWNTTSCADFLTGIIIQFFGVALLWLLIAIIFFVAHIQVVFSYRATSMSFSISSANKSRIVILGNNAYRMARLLRNLLFVNI